MTLYEKLKTMTIEEMASYLDSITDCTFCVYFSENNCHGLKCNDGIIKFLNQEVR